jgi:hypothetical protein
MKAELMSRKFKIGDEVRIRAASIENFVHDLVSERNDRSITGRAFDANVSSRR